MRLAPRSVRARLTLWYTLVLSVPLAAFAVASYVVFSRALHGRTDAYMSDALSVFGREVMAERRQVPSVLDALQKTLSEVRFQDLDILVLDENARVMAMSAPRRDDPDRPALHGDSAAVVGALTSRGPPPWATTLHRPVGAYRVLARVHPMDDRRFTLAGVYALREVEATLARIRRMFLIAIPLLILSAATGGWFLAKRSFAPVTAMATRAAEIGAATLHERLPVVADDELGALARVLNELLDRLEGSFAQQRRFMADASHELRTPLAGIRAEADVTLSGPERSQAEYRESMTVIQDAARRLTRIVDDIFLLARADAGHQVMHPGSVDLDEVVIGAVRAVQPIATGRRVRIELADVVDARIHGDADLLGRVMLNLLDNAVKHAPAESAVQVRMRSGTNGIVEVAVVDSGPGIPAEFHQRVFERFFRLDTARARAEPSATSGAGLGLAIARRIAEMHAGRVDLVSSAPGRTEFRVQLPVADSQRS
ncbi:MAG: ATP-binding protein [Gemmatimonadaceae bacterium]